LTRHEQVTKSNHSNSLPAACLLASTTATADGGSGGAGKVVQISSLPLLDCVTYFLVVFFFVMSVTKRKAECTNETKNRFIRILTSLSCTVTTTTTNCGQGGKLN